MPSWMQTAKLWAVASAVLFLTSVHLVFANDAAFYRGPSLYSATPVHNDSIRMVAERILVDVHLEPVGITSIRANIAFRCRYEFENLELQPVEIEIGFPINNTISAWSRNMLETEQAHEHQSVVPGSFRTWVNGTSVESELLQAEANPGLSIPDYDAVYLFPVQFRARERIIVEHTLTQVHPGRVATPSGTFGPFDINYILQTASAWSGPISHAQIEVTIHVPESLLDIVEVTPRTFERDTIAGRPRFRLNVEDFVPHSDVLIRFDLDREASAAAVASELDGWVTDRDLELAALGAYYLVTHPSTIDAIDPDLVRGTLYWAGNYHYFQENWGAAIHAFERSLYEAFTALTNGPNVMPDGFEPTSLYFAHPLDLSNVPVRSASEAPEYFAAYNLAAAYSRLAQERGDTRLLSEVTTWLDVAARINRRAIQPLIERDPDLEFYRRHR